MGMHYHNSRQSSDGDWLVNVPSRRLSPAGMFEVYNMKFGQSHGWFPTRKAANAYIAEMLACAVPDCDVRATWDGRDYDDCCAAHQSAQLHRDYEDV